MVIQLDGSDDIAMWKNELPSLSLVIAKSTYAGTRLP